MSGFPSRSRAGFTLVEMMVYSVSLGIMLYCIYAVLNMAMFCFRSSQESSDVQASAQKAALCIGTEVADSNAVTVSAGTNYIIFCSPRNALGGYTQESSGKFMWHKWVCFWVDSAGNLRRSEQILNAPLPTTPPLASSAPALSLMRTLPSRLIATNVDLSHSTPLAFTLGGGSVAFTGNFSSQSTVTAGSVASNTCQVKDLVKCRN